MGFILLLLLWISALLAANGLRPWILASAAVGFAVMLFGGALFERIQGKELQRAP